MASSLVDLVKINVSNTGAGAITLGSAVEGYRGRDVLTNGTVYSYSIQQGSAWEFGRGTYLAESAQIIRSVIDSSDGGTALDLKPNAQIAFTALSADLMPQVQLTADIQAKVDAATAAQTGAETAQGLSEDARDASVAAKDISVTKAGEASASATAADGFRARASNAVPFATWTALAAATGMSASDKAQVLAADTGTHTDPVVGGTVNNAGVYTYSASPAGWQRVADLESQTAAAVGAAQVAAIQTEGATQTLAVTNAAGAVSAAAALYANGLSNNDYSIEYESVGNLSQATLASNVGVYQVGLVNGTHIFSGDVITAMRWLWACGETTATVEINIWKRNVAGATGAGTLNNAAPIATHDTLIATITTTPAALGITAGTTNPAQTNNLALATPITVEAGFDLMFQFRNLDGSSAVVNCGFSYLSSAAGTQRRAGFQALTATPTTFTTLLTARSPSITLLKNTQKTRLPATDETLRTLLDAAAVETLSNMNQRNVDNLYTNAALFPLTLSAPASFWGDSLTRDATLSQPIAGYGMVEIVDALTIGTVNNYGINGQTSAQITARVVAASGTDLAGFNRVTQGTNDLGAGTPAAVLANYATCASAFTNANYLMCSPWMSGAQAGNINGRKVGDIRADLKTTYGAKMLDNQAYWTRYAFNSSDIAVSRGGGVPTNLTVDNLHKSTAGGLVHGHVHAAALIAQAGGAPFVHDDICGFKNGDASGATVFTPRILGTGYNFTILAGNDDGAIQINRATGVITRTSSTILQPYREVFVEGESNKGRGRNGRIIMVQQMDGTTPNKAVRVRGNTASLLMPRFDFTAPTTTEATIVLAVRQTSRKASAAGIVTHSTNSTIIDQNGWDTRAIWRTSAGASLGTQTLSPESPSLVNFYAFTIKTDTGLLRARLNLTTAVSGTPSAGNVDLAGIAYLLSNGGDTAPWSGDILMLAVYGAYYDLTDDAVIGRWWDNTTRLPKDIGASGTAGGALATPLIYLRGMAGDYILGKNYGSGGDLHAQVPVNGRNAGFVDVDL